MALLTGQVKKLLTLGGVKSFARCLLDSGQRFIEDSMRNLTAKITVKVSNQYAYDILDLLRVFFGFRRFIGHFGRNRYSHQSQTR